MAPRDPMTEVVDRMRRVETRITAFLEAQGFDTGVRRPRWADGDILVPSAQSSLQDILNTIPEDWPENEVVYVYLKRQLLMRVLPPPRYQRSDKQ